MCLIAGRNQMVSTYWTDEVDYPALLKIFDDQATRERKEESA
jgi:hypothetical protein